MIIIPITFLLILVLLYGLFNTLRDSLVAAGRHSLRGRRAASWPST